LNGRELSALDIQREYYDKVSDFADRRGLWQDPVHGRVLELWGGP
jgi:proteasome accessory factor A